MAPKKNNKKTQKAKSAQPSRQTARQVKFAAEFDAATITVTLPARVIPPDPNQIDKGSVPFTYGGTSTGPPTSMGYQVDTQAMKIMTSGVNPWSFTLTSQDCPNINQTYLVTIYAFKPPDPVVIKQVHFQRTG